MSYKRINAGALEDTILGQYPIWTVRKTKATEEHLVKQPETDDAS
jgi:hypothetical protein